MLQLSPQHRIFVCVSAVDFRCGIDGLGGYCRRHLQQDPMSGAIFVFRNRRQTAIKLLVYDGQGFWLCQKRFSSGRFRFWPQNPSGALKTLEAHQLHVLLQGGDPAAAKGAPEWRRVRQAG